MRLRALMLISGLISIPTTCPDWADGMNEVRKAAARSATHIKNAIALF